MDSAATKQELPTATSMRSFSLIQMSGVALLSALLLPVLSALPLGAAGDRDWAVLLSGQSAALTKDTNAAELVQRLAEETARRLRAFA